MDKRTFFLLEELAFRIAKIANIPDDPGENIELTSEQWRWLSVHSILHSILEAEKKVNPSIQERKYPNE